MAEARARLAALESPGLTNSAPGLSLEEAGLRRAGLRRLIMLYEQQAAGVAALRKAQARTAEITRKAGAWVRFDEPPPYSILLTDELGGELQSEREKIRNGEAAAALLDRLVEENRELLARAEESLRQLNERLEGAGASEAMVRLATERENQRLRSHVAAATLAALESERLASREMLVGSRIQVDLLERQLVFAKAAAGFTQADLEKVIGRVDRRREQLESELVETKSRQAGAARALALAREELDRVSVAAGNAAAVALAREVVAAREAQLEAAETAANVLRPLLESLNVERTMWELRFAAHDSRNVETLRESQRRLEALVPRLSLWRDFCRHHLEAVGNELQAQESRLNGLDAHSALLAPARERLEAWRERQTALLRFARGVEELRRLADRWEEGLRVAGEKLPLTGKVRNLFGDARSFLKRFWGFEVFTAEDTITVDGQKITGKRSVTIGKVVMAVFILAFGVWLTGLVTRRVEPVIVRRLKIEPNQADLIRRWLRALMIACLVIFSLVSVKIPLTVFAFAGGALAIGLGFGMQTILKNFVSGLILLFERPFRVGDVLDVAGQQGTVTSIGLRASVLRLYNGTETLIPNSSLLENNVTNWTYTDQKVRFSVEVGVAYGSDPRRVIQLMEDVAERHGLVEKEPKPMVLFTLFGDSTLVFELRFWVSLSRANSAQVSSDLRLMIAHTFAEHGISIDYPQRDVHLHSVNPLPVRVVTTVGDGVAVGRAATCLALGALLFSGCTAPIGADRARGRQVYAQVEANALRTGKPSSSTRMIIHRYGLEGLAARQPDEIVRRLHEKAVATGERDLVYALAEMSYLAGERVRRSVKAWEAREARDYYLGSALYAWLFLFGDAADPLPQAFDRRFRDACDFYNYSLGLALMARSGTNGTVHLTGGRRRLPVGEVELRLDRSGFGSKAGEFERMLAADQFRVRGLSVRNRQPGVGTPLICVLPATEKIGVPPCEPATLLLRGPVSLADLGSGKALATLELYSAFDQSAVRIGEAAIPLEIDLTTYRAYALNDARAWSIGRLAFLAPAERFPNHLILNQPFKPDRIPVVFVHGTFSSPVTWAEMANSLTADPVLRQRYQIWSFMYGSGNPLAQSISDFRRALTDQVNTLDPKGTNTALRRMVIIGHSQGGLLTKSTGVHAGDRLWNVFSTNRIEEARISPEYRDSLRRALFLEPLPFVRRVVFIATPHRGSYLAGGFARRLAHRFVSLPGNLAARSVEVLRLSEGSAAGKFFRGRAPTSLDGMSPKNPSLLAMADIPIAPEIKAHSIIPVRGKGDPAKGRDGVVSYPSAHLEGVESELVVRGGHGCLGQPATIGEVRRILLRHLESPGER
jgi:small-conductance mechanosensitive channel/pimeloyl-ACP methyl ester carboxylesterase